MKDNTEIDRAISALEQARKTDDVLAVRLLLTEARVAVNRADAQNEHLRVKAIRR